VGEEKILIDCGNGTTIQMTRAGIDPTTVGYLFFTHHHFDHNVDFAHFILSTWIMSRTLPLRVFGPVGTTKFARTVLDAFEVDVRSRLAGGRFRENQGLVFESKDIDQGFVLSGNGWKLSCARVDHLTWNGNYTLGYRIDAAGRSITFAADTSPCEAVVRLAMGSDVLVHEVFHAPELEKGGIMPGRHRQEASKDSLAYVTPRKHSLPAQAGKIAHDAKVKKLVLTHFFSDADLERIVDQVRQHFDGEVVLGEDLLEI
jgi:ribonuclease Z